MMMKRTLLFITILTIFAMLFSACTPGGNLFSQSGPIVVQDGDGNEFRLEKAAQRVISLAPSNTEILFAVGAGKQVIAREDFSNFPEEAKSLPSIGGNMGKYNLEEIVKLQPDLILASPLTSADVLQSLKTITPSVFVVPNPKDIEGLYANLKTVGILTGHKTEADQLAGKLEERVKAVQEKVAPLSYAPKVFYELDATEPSKPWTAGEGTFIDMLIGMAGGFNIGNTVEGEYAQISQEALIVENPDVIVLGDSAYGTTPESVAARPGWDQINAVKNGKVYGFNDDLASRPGPRMVDGLEALAKLLHPDVFK